MLRLFFTFFISLYVFATSAQADRVHVAVASNFAQPAKDLAQAFAELTGHKAILSFGSTGKLYVQIKNGAPFGVFLSADAERAQKLEQEGKGVAGSRFTYAEGRLALFSMSPTALSNAPNDLESFLRANKFAMANPLTAPYGQATLETLAALGIHNLDKGKIIRGENIAQTYQFVRTRNVLVGFVAASQVKEMSDTQTWIVPVNLHSPIQQQGILIKKDATNPAAIAFMTFLKSEPAQNIVRNWGYDIPSVP